MRLAAFFLILALMLSAGSAFGEQQEAQPTLGLKLASIDAGRRLMPGDPLVRRATGALASASSRCAAGAGATANHAVVIADEVRRHGNAASAVEVLEGLDAVLIDQRSKQDCVRVLASYAAVRLQGVSHSQAVVSQRALLKQSTLNAR